MYEIDVELDDVKCFLLKEKTTVMDNISSHNSKANLLAVFKL
jgi:hypothetical protein